MLISIPKMRTKLV